MTMPYMKNIYAERHTHSPAYIAGSLVVEYVV